MCAQAVPSRKARRVYQLNDASNPGHRHKRHLEIVQHIYEATTHALEEYPSTKRKPIFCSESLTIYSFHNSRVVKGVPDTAMLFTTLTVSLCKHPLIWIAVEGTTNFESCCFSLAVWLKGSVRQLELLPRGEHIRTWHFGAGREARQGSRWERPTADLMRGNHCKQKVRHDLRCRVVSSATNQRVIEHLQSP